MLGANRDGILIGGKAMSNLRTNSGASQRVHRMVVGCTQRITLVIPGRNYSP